MLVGGGAAGGPAPVPSSVCLSLAAPFALSLEAAPHCFKAAKKEGCGGCFRQSACTAPCVHSLLASAACFPQVFG